MLIDIGYHTAFKNWAIQFGHIQTHTRYTHTHTNKERDTGRDHTVTMWNFDTLFGTTFANQSSTHSADTLDSLSRFIWFFPFRSFRCRHRQLLHVSGNIYAYKASEHVSVTKEPFRLPSRRPRLKSVAAENKKRATFLLVATNRYRRCRWRYSEAVFRRHRLK